MALEIKPAEEAVKVDPKELSKEQAKLVNQARKWAKLAGLKDVKINTVQDVNELLERGVKELSTKATPEAFLKAINTPNGKAFLNSKQGKAFVEWFYSEKGQARLSEGPRGFIIGLVGIIGIGWVLKLFGLPGEFAFIAAPHDVAK